MIKYSSPTLTLYVSVFLFLALTTIVFYLLFPAYKAVDKQLLSKPSFAEGGPQGWEIGGDIALISKPQEGGVQMTLTEKGNSYLVSREIASTRLNKVVLLRAKLSSENIQPGVKDWEKGRILLIQYTGDQALWKYKHELVRLSGNTPVKEYALFFIMQPETTHIKVGIELKNCSGSISCYSCGLYNAIEVNEHHYVQWGIIVLWFMYCMFLFGFRILKAAKQSKLMGTALALVLIIIFVGTSLPGKDQNAFQTISYKVGDSQNTQLAVEIGQAFNTIFHSEKQHILPQYPLDTNAKFHFILFFLVAMLLMLNSAYDNILLLCFDLLLLACSTEFMQLFVWGRRTSLDDVCMDMFGCCVGVGVAWLISSLNCCKK